MSRCEFDDRKYDAWISRIEHKIDRILVLLNRQGTHIMAIQDDINTLVAAVGQQTTIAQSVKALLEQLTAIINTIKSQIADPAAVAQLEQAVAALQANNQAIQDAVTANTPPAP